MPNYNWDAINRGMALDMPLWKTKKCDVHGQYNDIVSFANPHSMSEHHKKSVTHGCVLPMSNSAAKMVEEAGLTIGNMTPDHDPAQDLERELFRAKADYDRIVKNNRLSLRERLWNWMRGGARR